MLRLKRLLRIIDNLTTHNLTNFIGIDEFFLFFKLFITFKTSNEVTGAINGNQLIASGTIASGTITSVYSQN